MMKYNEDSYFDMIRGMESLECFRQERVVEPPLILYFQNLIAKNLLNHLSAVYSGELPLEYNGR